jgi:excisionase family DNA binding protein
MDGILEQILIELKEIRKLLIENKNVCDPNFNGRLVNDTMTTKEAAEYLGIAVSRVRILAKQGKIKHFMAGNKRLYKKKSLDQWLEEVQEYSIVSQ